MHGLKQCFDVMPDFILEPDQAPFWRWQWRGLSGKLQETTVGINMSTPMLVQLQLQQQQDAAYLLMTAQGLEDYWWHMENEQLVLNGLISRFIIEDNQLLQDKLLKFIACARFFYNLWLGNLSKEATLKMDSQGFLNDIV